MNAIPSVVAVEVVDDRRLLVRFDDGAEGEVDVAAVVGDMTGVFEALQDPASFAAVTVDPDSGTVVWPSGADIDPIVLYEAATGRSISSSWSAAEPKTTYGDI